MIDISEMYADRVPAPFVLLNESSADGAARGIAFHRWRIDVVLLRCAAEAAVVLQRNLGGARGGRPALVIVALEQSLAAPAAEHGRQFPAEVECILDAGIHAETAVRRMRVRSVAGKEHPTVHEAIGD